MAAFTTGARVALCAQETQTCRVKSSTGGYLLPSVHQRHLKLKRRGHVRVNVDQVASFSHPCSSGSFCPSRGLNTTVLERHTPRAITQTFLPQTTPTSENKTQAIGTHRDTRSGHERPSDKKLYPSRWCWTPPPPFACSDGNQSRDGTSSCMRLSQIEPRIRSSSVPTSSGLGLSSSQKRAEPSSTILLQPLRLRIKN